ncbi:MAG: trehalase family glycosidase [Myxococcota bacterium]
MKHRNDHLLRQHDMEGEGIPEAHTRGLDLEYRAPDLTPDQVAELPRPILDGRPEWLELYWRTWAIAFDRVRVPDPSTGFQPFCDAAFSEHIFQWDTCFLMGFARFASHALPVEGTFDNFYAKQHADGFICREISSLTGDDFWSKEHPSAINPPLFADGEWGLYHLTGDVSRIRRVFPLLCRYDDWLRRHRRHGDGVGYWTTSLASGMDNTPRAFLAGGDDANRDYGHSWMCLAAQQALSAQKLEKMAALLGYRERSIALAEERRRIVEYLDQHCWNDELGFYVDRDQEGDPTDVLTPASLWAILSGAGNEERWSRTFEILRSPEHFWRPHALPSVSAAHPTYFGRGNYWQGSVWPPMVVLALRAARAVGREGYAIALAMNHLDNLHRVYTQTGTLWENYASETASKGNISRPEFVGWTGCGPIEALIEVIIGLRPTAKGELTWVSHREDRHGVENLRVQGKVASLALDPTRSRLEYDVSSDIAVELRRGDTVRTFLLPAGAGELEVEC